MLSAGEGEGAAASRRGAGCTNMGPGILVRKERTIPVTREHNLGGLWRDQDIPGARGWDRQLHPTRQGEEGASVQGGPFPTAPSSTKRGIITLLQSGRYFKEALV